MLRRSLPFLLLCLLSLTTHGRAQDAQLRYQLPAQATYTYLQVEETNALAQSNDGRNTNLDRKTTRYFTMQVTESSKDGFTYLSTQDTAIVEENTADPRIQRQNVIVQNILTHKPVLVRQPPNGLLRESSAQRPLQAERLLGPGASDAMFAQRAVLLPSLPQRPLRPGLRWTEEHGDTLQPTKSLPRFGEGKGVRYVQSRTEYVVEGMEDVDGTQCVRISWQGDSRMEEKIIFSSLEEYSEEHTSSSGNMLVEVKSGLPHRVEAYSDKEFTRAVFGEQSGVIPSSISTHTVLELISQ